MIKDNHLAYLEAESIHIMREAVAEGERPAMLFSGGKDSAVMLALAVKAFWPARLPFPLMHVDTGENFAEVLAYRDRRVAELEADLVVASVQEAIDQGRIQDVSGVRSSRNRLQTESLLHGIEQHRFSTIFGGARRDEERARAKERVFSFRDDFGQWDPKNQRPELWSLYNARHNVGEHIRVFPISNWTEMDIWHYIKAEELDLPSIYFAHERSVFERDGMLMADHELVERTDAEKVFTETVRFRTVGDITCTGAFASVADSLDGIIAEVSAATITERGASRADDKMAEAAMEDRKREGYF